MSLLAAASFDGTADKRTALVGEPQSQSGGGARIRDGVTTSHDLALAKSDKSRIHVKKYFCGYMVLLKVVILAALTHSFIYKKDKTS